MKFLLKSFINGILTFVPIILVFFVIYKVFTFFDNILGNYLKPYMMDTYIPGIGLIFTILIITIFGWLSTQYISGKFIILLDKLLENMPFVKTIYSVIKDTVHAFIGEKRSFSKVVLVEVPGTAMKSLGFITSEEVDNFSSHLSDHVAVYIPQTFQVAGFTFLIPREQITILDVKPEDAMKFILSGGITSKRNP